MILYYGFLYFSQHRQYDMHERQCKLPKEDLYSHRTNYGTKRKEEF